MTHSISYPNARAAAISLKDLLVTRGWENISAHPWNMYYPESTLWWVIPSKAWPAYKHGKFFFSPERAPDGGVLCGLHIEKGVDPTAAAAYTSTRDRHLIMRDDWTWFDFLKDLKSGQVSYTIENAYQVKDLPVIIQFEAGFLTPSNSRRPHDESAWDLAVLEIHNSSLSIKDQRVQANLLSSIFECEKLDDLANSITEIRHMKGIWLDVFVGVYFEFSENPKASAVWNISEIWSKALTIWEPWFK